jgi:hypothetical protein
MRKASKPYPRAGYSRGVLEGKDVAVRFAASAVVDGPRKDCDQSRGTPSRQRR